jgi:hypothetical protein
MTTTVTTTSKIKNYQGDNSFVLKMKDSLSKYGRLTEKQLAAVEKALMTKSEVKVDELPEDMKRIANYVGENSFVLDIKKKLLSYGTLTFPQTSAAVKQIQKEEDKANTRKMNIPTIGETIKVGRSIGQQMKEQYGLKFNPILLDITKVLAVSPKAVKFSGKMTVKRGDVCVCCAKTLTDEFSMLTGVGKTCATHMRIPYITDVTQADRFREDYLRRVDEIGEMEFWVPKAQLKKWEGKTEVVLQMI